MATLVIACPICLQKIRAPANVVGRQIRCPQCKNGFTAADPAAVSDPSALPSAPRPREPVPDEESAADPLGLESDDDVAAEPASNALIDFILLRRMITPSILVALFWFGVALIVLAGLVGAIVGIVSMVSRTTPVLPGLLMVLLDFVLTLGALLFWRVTCETLGTVFRTSHQVKELIERNRAE
jgi:hypothetical protein